jgi:hypothetical protein
MRHHVKEGVDDVVVFDFSEVDQNAAPDPLLARCLWLKEGHNTGLCQADLSHAALWCPGPGLAAERDRYSGPVLTGWRILVIRKPFQISVYDMYTYPKGEKRKRGKFYSYFYPKKNKRRRPSIRSPQRTRF